MSSGIKPDKDLEYRQRVERIKRATKKAIMGSPILVETKYKIIQGLEALWKEELGDA